MGAPAIEVPRRSTARIRDAVAVWFVFAIGGFAMAVATFVACGEASLVWGVLRDGSPGGSVLWTIGVGVPLIGVMDTIYGLGFVSAYLSLALGVAATAAAVAVWRSGRISMSHLVGLLVTCPVAVGVQASVLGVGFDPFSETEDDALTMRRVVILFSPLLVPALVGAWFIVRRWCDRGGDRARHPAPTP